MFNKASCECDCPAWEFGEKKVLCETRRDQYWDSMNCQCRGQSFLFEDNLQKIRNDRSPENTEDSSTYTSVNRAMDLIVWVLLGSSLTLVIVLAVVSGGYKRQLEEIRDGKEGIVRQGFPNILGK